MIGAAPPTRSVTTLRPGPLRVVDGLLAPRYAARLLEHWEGFGGYGRSSDGGTQLGPPLACATAHRPRPATGVTPPAGATPALFTALGQRADANANYVRTGGRTGSAHQDRASLHARTDYFRATYVDGQHIWAPLLCRLLNHPVLTDTAREVFDHAVVVPTVIYANVLMPGQELGLHTDVPQFRGATRASYPLWLLVVMHQSRLFERWRTHIATAVVHLGQAAAPGGDFRYYPDGPDGAAVTVAPRHNTALVLDTDSVMHGVDRVGGADAVPMLRPGARLHCSNGVWRLIDSTPGRRSPPVGGWSSPQLRYSISWKAQCFRDDAERRLALSHTDDLTYAMVLDRLLAPLPAGSAALSADQLGRRLIDTYIRFPPTSPAR